MAVMSDTPCSMHFVYLVILTVSGPVLAPFVFRVKVLVQIKGLSEKQGVKEVQWRN